MVKVDSKKEPDPKKEPEEWLDYFLFRGTDPCLDLENFLKRLCKEIREGSFTLKNIGIDEEEKRLKELGVKIRQILTEEWLEYHLSRVICYKDYLKHLLCRKIEEGEFITLKDMGISREKLEKVWSAMIEK